jgi:hypothetical protein
VSVLGRWPLAADVPPVRVRDAAFPPRPLSSGLLLHNTSDALYLCLLKPIQHCAVKLR